MCTLAYSAEQVYGAQSYVSCDQAAAHQARGARRVDATAGALQAERVRHSATLVWSAYPWRGRNAILYTQSTTATVVQGPSQALA